MSETRLGIEDYPLAEKRPQDVKSKRGTGLDEITLDAVLSGKVEMDDLRITAVALRQQAEIAEAAGRATLAANFLRAAELVDIPQNVVMEIYELLRPGRALQKQKLLDAASRLRLDYVAPRMAAFVEEAADVYERRGLFTFRY